MCAYMIMRLFQLYILFNSGAAYMRYFIAPQRQEVVMFQSETTPLLVMYPNAKDYPVNNWTEGEVEWVFENNRTEYKA